VNGPIWMLRHCHVVQKLSHGAAFVT
jgi:hypothetical protein